MKAHLARRNEFTDDSVDNIRGGEEVNEHLYYSDLGEDLSSQLRAGLYLGQSLQMILKPVVESLQAIVLELVLLAAHSQRVLTSAPSSGIIKLQ